MKLKQFTLGNLKRAQAFTPVLVVGVLMLTGAVIYNFNAKAATSGFYFSSAGTSYKVGDTFNVSVYENSGSQCANVVQADFSYPANLLRLNSASSASSNFESTAPSSSTSGNQSLVQYTSRKECGTGAAATSGVSGDQLVSTVSFTVLASGSAQLAFKNSSIAISSADNSTNVSPTRTNTTFSLTTPVSPTPAPTPAPTPPPTPKPNPTPAPSGPPTPKPVTPPTKTTTTTKPVTPPAVTSVTPANTESSVPVANNDVVQVSTPVDINPLPIQPDGINRIEYYLNGKLKATVKTAPYTYRLDTTKLLNGKYTLTTKTFYLNGQSKSVSQTVAVKNPLGFGQFVLWAKKYAWIFILLILLIGAAIAAWIIHRRKDNDDYFDDGTYDNLAGPAPTYAAATNDGIVAPDNNQSSAGYTPQASLGNVPLQSSWQPRPTAASPAPQPGVISPNPATPLTPSVDLSDTVPSQPSNIIRPTQQPPQ